MEVTSAEVVINCPYIYIHMCVQYRYIPWDVLPTKGDDITSSPPTITEWREQPKVMKAQVQMMFLLQR